MGLNSERQMCGTDTRETPTHTRQHRLDAIPLNYLKVWSHLSILWSSGVTVLSRFCSVYHAGVSESHSQSSIDADGQ